ncbi:MAG: hypothetical protein MUC35_02600 [Candidatus Margulisbacteria bacterium]|jgi:hypothetical protein|nr:hypothetical protein [Candidatus Margulisiibacteriota bacterium]
MRKPQLFLIVAVIAVLLGLAFWYVRAGSQPVETVPAQGTPEATAVKPAPLPKVITLFRKGDSESDLAIYVSRELSRELKDKVAIRLINIDDEPQMAEYYGVTEFPAVVILTPGGAVRAKHDGYWDKAEILGVLKTISAN